MKKGLEISKLIIITELVVDARKRNKFTKTTTTNFKKEDTRAKRKRKII